MKRLTFRTDMGDDLLDAIAFLNPDDAGGMYNLRDIGEYGSDELLLEIANRLAEYEDTGLEPEEILTGKELAEVACALISLKEYKSLGTIDHIRELLKAEKDGRLVVLPCKVGDTLWVTGRDNVPREMELEAPDIRTVCTDEDNLCMSTCNRKPDGFCAYRLRNDGADIGKTVFLNREEAEKALEDA